MHYLRNPALEAVVSVARTGSWCGSDLRLWGLSDVGCLPPAEPGVSRVTPGRRDPGPHGPRAQPGSGHGAAAAAAAATTVTTFRGCNHQWMRRCRRRWCTCRLILIRFVESFAIQSDLDHRRDQKARWSGSLFGPVQNRRAYPWNFQAKYAC
jgi:hypothetical protein